MADNKKQDNEKQETIEVDAKVIPDGSEKNEKSSGKLRNLGKKIKVGVKKIVDSTPFRVATGVLSAAALGAAGVILMGKISDSDTSFTENEGMRELDASSLPDLLSVDTTTDTTVDTSLPF